MKLRARVESGVAVKFENKSPGKYKPMSKKVTFDENKNECYVVEMYDRLPIQSVLYLRCYNKITSKEWIQIHEELNEFKYKEMVVHKDSLRNTRFH